MSRDDSLLDYYARRAAEYDRIYGAPERQADLEALVRAVREDVAARRVLEIACGTGWWTEKLSAAASRVVATDAAPEVLARARERGGGPAPVEFRVADAFSPESIDGEFDTLVAGFWISHVTRAGVAPFLRAWERRLGPGARVVLFDNRFVPGKSTPLSRRSGAGDTFQVRRLDDGSEHEILKNFFDAAELRAFAPPGAEPRIREDEFYWYLRYDVPAGSC